MNARFRAASGFGIGGAAFLVTAMLIYVLSPMTGAVG